MRYVGLYINHSTERGVETPTGDLSVYPLCGIFYFPWHRHQIEGTDGF